MKSGGYTALGELALDGSLTSVAGVLLAALAPAGRGDGNLPGGEPAWAGEAEIVAAPSLLAIVKKIGPRQPKSDAGHTSSFHHRDMIFEVRRGGGDRGCSTFHVAGALFLFHGFCVRRL